MAGRYLSDKTQSLIGIEDVEAHLRRRKSWNRAMAPSAVREYEAFIAKRARQLVERLEEEKKRGVAQVMIGVWFKFFACVVGG